MNGIRFYRISLFFFFITLYFTGCAYLSYLKDPFTDIPQFYQVTEDIYRGGYPTSQGYEKLRSLGIKTIINLSGEDERLERERLFAEKVGIKVVHIPLSVYSAPTDEDLGLFLSTINESKNRPVFVHCTSGRDRTGAMIAVFRVIVEKKDPAEAYKEALRYGFWPNRGGGVLKRYILQVEKTF